MAAAVEELPAGFTPDYRCTTDGVMVHRALRQPDTAAQLATPPPRKRRPPVEREVSFNLDSCAAEETDEEDAAVDTPMEAIMREPLGERKPRANTWSHFGTRKSSITFRARSYSEADASKLKLDPSVYDCSPKRNRNERLIMASWVVLFPFYLAYLAMHEFPVDEEDKLNDALLSGWYRFYMRQKTKIQARNT